MTNAFDPGIYEVISSLTIRREPRITSSNRAGSLTIGTRRQVYSVVTNPDNSTWGRISEPDAAGIALWMCLQNINRTFARHISDPPAPITDVGELTARFLKLENWAREQGYE